MDFRKKENEIIMTHDDVKFCDGKHKCVLCEVVYDCEGVGYGHDNSKEGNCHGTYEQFCSNHEIQEYIDYHKEHREI